MSWFLLFFAQKSLASTLAFLKVLWRHPPLCTPLWWLLLFPGSRLRLACVCARDAQSRALGPLWFVFFVSARAVITQQNPAQLGPAKFIGQKNK
jgi:hypothetical protein